MVDTVANDEQHRHAAKIRRFMFRYFRCRSLGRLYYSMSSVKRKPSKFLLSGAITLCFSWSALAAPDLETGRQINQVCAACHGDNGQGGKKGEYPRLAGQRQEYLSEQLAKFKARKRINIPMFPYTEERELPDEDIGHISAYLASIKLDTQVPVFKDEDDALTRLTVMEKILNIPRSEGDVAAGAKHYRTECASCHGLKGQGKAGTPVLAGQYTIYLQRQFEKFIKNERIHDEEAKPGKDVLNLMKPEELRDILAFLTTLDDE